MPTGGNESPKPRSARARHAALRVIDAVERLERIGIAEHAKIIILFDGPKKVTLYIEGISLGATSIESPADENGVE